MKIALLFLISAFVISSANSLEITYQYSPTIDKACEKRNEVKVSKRSISELQEKLPQLQKAWNQRVPIFLQAIKELTGKEFKTKEIKASVFICKESSYSVPMKLWVAPYLKSYEKKTQSSDSFTRLVLHEILHIFTVENLQDRSSKLLKKYANESRITQNHLYVMAMQKAIFLKLNLREELTKHIKHETSLGGPYARSWKIVNDIEGFQPFVNELIGDKNSKY